MQKAKVTDNIEFAYHDSGPPPAKDDYYTIIVIHGHTYHSGTFAPMLEKANSYGYRIVLPNRRLYPGSTPYTAEEYAALSADNPTEDIIKAFLKQCEYLLLFVDNVIKELDLKEVILAGWSLGTNFLSGLVYNITSANEEIKLRLRQTVKTVVWWDTPATAHRFLNPPTAGRIPLYDKTIPPKQRGQVFGQWVSQYYPHPNIDKKDCYTLIYRIDKPVKPPSFTDISPEEFLTKVELTAGVNGDNHISELHFQPVASAIRDLAIFNAEVRDAWGNIPFNILYGEESPYNVLWAAWQFEAESKKTGIPLGVIGMPGVNHFPMHDDPKISFDSLYACL